MEKEEYKKFKKRLIITWIFAILPFAIFLPLVGEYNIAIIMILAVTMSFGGIYLIYVIANKIKLFLKKKYITKKVKEYKREIPKKYTVSMASLLLDNAFDEIIDIPAIILSLIGKNILSYNDDNNILDIKHIESFPELYDHEKYVYECIKENKKIQPDKFRRYVIEDAIKNNYIKKIKFINPSNKAFFLSATFIIVMVICCITLDKLPEYIYITINLILFFSAIIAPVVVFNKYDLDKDNPYKNTKLGNKEVKNILGLKKYLEDFSMIDNKRIKEVMVWEDYLAYAYMLGINKKIFEEFKELEQIKNIVN